MIKKADSSLVHSKNQMALLNTIFDLNSTSRSELSRILKLSKPSVAEHLSLLLERGIITEEDDGHFSGRKPRAVHFCPSFCYIVAVDLHYDDPTFVLSDLSGKILDEFSIRVKKSTPFELRLNSLINGIHMLLNANTIDPKKLLSIAVSAPGVYTSDSHVSFSNKQHSSWNTNRLLLELQSEFKTNVFFSNDAKAAAVGEYTELARDNINNLVYVSCGLGIGAGIILNGKLFSGNGNAAGEIFNYITPENLEKNLNLENKVSILSVLESVKSHKEKYSSSFYSDIPPEELCFSHVLEAYKKRDSLTLEILQAAGKELGCVIANIANLLTIEAIVLGGEYDQFSDLFLETISEVTGRYCLVSPQVIPSKLGRYAGIRGLLIMARQNIFQSIAEGSK